MVYKTGKSQRMIFGCMIIILSWLCNAGAEYLSTQEGFSGDAAYYKDRELEWDWVVKLGEYEDCLLLGKGLIAVKKENGFYGVMDRSGKFVFSDEYEYIGKYCEGLARVRYGEKIFFTDLNGIRISDKSFQDAYDFQEGKAAVRADNGLWGFINNKGDVVIDCKFHGVNDFSEGLAAVRISDQWGFMNETGKVIIPCRYDEVRNFSEGLAAVRQEGQWGFIDQYGNMITTFRFDEVRDFNESYAAVRQKDKWGFINREGKTSIALMYDAVGDFSEGKAAVKLNNYFDGSMDAWAYIDKNNKAVIDYYPYTASEGRMEYAGRFRDGIAFVSDGYYSMIDDEGNRLFDGQDSQFIISSLEYNKEYDAIPGYIYEDDAMTIKKYGLVGLHGIQRLEPVFDYVHEIFDDYVLVSQKLDDGWVYGVIEISD